MHSIVQFVDKYNHSKVHRFKVWPSGKVKYAQLIYAKEIAQRSDLTTSASRKNWSDYCGYRQEYLRPFMRAQKMTLSQLAQEQITLTILPTDEQCVSLITHN